MIAAPMLLFIGVLPFVFASPSGSRGIGENAVAGGR